MENDNQNNKSEKDVESIIEFYRRKVGILAAKKEIALAELVRQAKKIKADELANKIKNKNQP